MEWEWYGSGVGVCHLGSEVIRIDMLWGQGDFFFTRKLPAKNVICTGFMNVSTIFLISGHSLKGEKKLK